MMTSNEETGEVEYKGGVYTVIWNSVTGDVYFIDPKDPTLSKTKCGKQLMSARSLAEAEEFALTMIEKRW